MFTYTARFMRSYLQLASIHEKKSILTRTHTTLYVISFMFACTIQAIRCVKSPDLHDILSQAPCFVFHINLGAQWLVAYFYKDAYWDRTRILNREFFPYEGEMRKAANLPKDPVFKHLYRFQVVLYGMHFTYISMPFVLSYFFGLNDLANQDSLIYPCWVPWPMTADNYWATYLVQFVPSALCCVINPFTTLYIIFVIMEVRRQKRVILAALRNLEQVTTEYTDAEMNTLKMNGMKFDKVAIFEQRYVSNIRQCITHHKRIIRFVNDFSHTYHWIFIANVLFSILVFTLNSYLIMTGIDSKSKLIQRSLELFMVFPILFVYSHAGETFKDVNNELKDAIYDLSWYERSNPVRRILLIFNTRTYQELELHVTPSTVASYPIFVSVLKASYSYANVLLTAYKRSKAEN